MTTANERADGPLVYAFCEFHMALALSHAFAPRSASAGDSPSAGRGVSQSVPALSAG
jgi:hypothetical protein